MVIIALTSAGLNEALKLPLDEGVSIWCGSDTISESDFKALEKKGLTRFSHPLAEMDVDALSEEINTVKEHHPSEVIFIESL